MIANEPEVIKVTEQDFQEWKQALPEHLVTISNLHHYTQEDVLYRLTQKYFPEDDNLEPIVLENLEQVAEYVYICKHRTNKNTVKSVSTSTIEDLEDVLGDRVKQRKLSQVLIPPTLLFSYTKKCLDEAEEPVVREKLLRFTQIFNTTSRTGQLALREEAGRQILYLSKKQQAAGLGFKKYIMLDTLQLLMRNVAEKPLKDEKQPSKKKILFLKPFREFPRLVPENVIKRLEEVQKKNLFEEFWILYLDYTAKELTSTSQRIREKDPILFGKLDAKAEELFYITDWVDEYCDLTLDKIVNMLHNISPDYKLPEVTEVKPSDLTKIFRELDHKERALASANSMNYRDLAAKTAKLTKTNFLTNFFKKLFRK